MRVAKSADEFEFQFNMAQRESANAFGDDTMYIEKFIENPRAMWRFRSWEINSAMW